MQLSDLELLSFRLLLPPSRTNTRDHAGPWIFGFWMNYIFGYVGDQHGWCSSSKEPLLSYCGTHGLAPQMGTVWIGRP